MKIPYDKDLNINNKKYNYITGIKDSLNHTNDYPIITSSKEDALIPKQVEIYLNVIHKIKL